MEIKLYMIGKGSYGKVYKRNDGLVYKQMPYYSPEKDSVNISTITEISMLRCIDHQNIIGCKEIHFSKEEKDLNVNCVMERGKFTLFEWTVKNPLNIREQMIETICSQIASGLTYLHKNNIIHGDLKPNNIVVMDNSEIKIIDFGGSVLNGLQTRFSNCTQTFSAPEAQITPNTQICLKSDVFSLGLVILFILTQQYYVFKSNEPETVQIEVLNPVTNQKTIEKKQIEYSYLYDDMMIQIDIANIRPEFKLILKKMLDMSPSTRISSLEIIKSGIFNISESDIIYNTRLIDHKLQIIDYFVSQKDLNYEIREVLFDWVYDVCKEYDIVKPYPYICRCIDFILSKIACKPNEVQMLACVGILLIFPLFGYEITFEELAERCDNSFDPDLLDSVTQKILEDLNFYFFEPCNINFSISYDLLHWFYMSSLSLYHDFDVVLLSFREIQTDFLSIQDDTERLSFIVNKLNLRHPYTIDKFKTFIMTTSLQNFKLISSSFDTQIQSILFSYKNINKQNPENLSRKLLSRKLCY